VWNDELARDFFPDGSLRDIIVRGTTIADWQALLTFASERYAPVELRRLDQATSLAVQLSAPNFSGGPERLDVAFGIGANSRLIGLFFAPDEIELSFDPATVANSSDLDHLIAFVCSLGQLLGKDVLVTMENESSAPIFVATPDGNIRYIESGRA
jgi:hypothetical protein